MLYFNNHIHHSRNKSSLLHLSQSFKIQQLLRNCLYLFLLLSSFDTTNNLFQLSSATPICVPRKDGGNLSDLYNYGEFMIPISVVYNNSNPNDIPKHVAIVTPYFINMRACGLVTANCHGCVTSTMCVRSSIGGAIDFVPFLTMQDLESVQWTGQNAPIHDNDQFIYFGVGPTSTRPVPFLSNFTQNSARIQNIKSSYIQPPPIDVQSIDPEEIATYSDDPSTTNLTWPLPFCNENLTTRVVLHFTCLRSPSPSYSSTVVVSETECVYTVLIQNPVSCSPQDPNSNNGNTNINVNIIIAIALCCLIGFAIFYISCGYIFLRYALNRHGASAYSHLLCVKSLEECCCGLDTGIYSVDAQSTGTSTDGPNPNNTNCASIQSFRTEDSCVHYPASPESITRNSVGEAPYSAVFTPSLPPRSSELYMIEERSKSVGII